jgi:hypothetical protein
MSWRLTSTNLPIAKAPHVGLAASVGIDHAHFRGVLPLSISALM